MLLLLVFPAVLFLFFLYTLLCRGKSSHSLPSPPGLPIIGHLHLLGTLPHRALHKLSKSHGPVMQLRFGFVPVVVVSTAKMAELFLKTHDAVFASRPTVQAREILSYGSKGIGSSKYGRYWRNMRKLVNVHLLSVSKIDSFVPMRQKEVTDFVQDLRQAGEVVDISAKVGLVIEKITYNMIFGGGNKEMFKLKPFILEAIRLAGVFNLADLVPITKSMDLQGLKGRMKGASKAIDDFLETTIREHEQIPIGGHEYHKGFIDILLSLMKSSSSADEEKLDKTDIKAIILDMLIAALDTTVITIERILTELLRNPRIMKRVQEELVEVVGLDRMVEEADLDKLIYLNMAVKETMRLHPVAPLLIPHESTEDISIQGYRIPKETQIMINAWAIGRDTNAWSDSNVEEFHPERFTNTDIDLRGHDTQLIPFGSGRRKCPGMEMGLRTVNFVTAQVLHCFNLELPYGMSPEDMDMTEKFELTMPRSSPLLALPIYRLHKQGLH